MAPEADDGAHGCGHRVATCGACGVISTSFRHRGGALFLGRLARAVWLVMHKVLQGHAAQAQLRYNTALPQASSTTGVIARAIARKL